MLINYMRKLAVSGLMALAVVANVDANTSKKNTPSYITSRPVVQVFTIQVAPEKNEAFTTAIQDKITASLNAEKGTLAMFSLKGEGDLAYVVEVYATPEDYQTHLEGQAQQTYNEQTQELVENVQALRLAPQYVFDRKFTPSEQTLVKFERVSVKTEYLTDYRELVLQELQQAVRNEPGIYAVYAANRMESPSEWLFITVYADNQAFEKHGQQDYYLNYLEQSQEMLNSREEVPVTVSLLMSKGKMRYNSLNDKTEFLDNPRQ